jgi:ubiquinone/menaquinone biosynthesis C-methylase UbiE
LADAVNNIAWDVFWRLHEGLSKQGPGSDASTRRALEIIGSLPVEPRILDLGCGPGRQSLVLARETQGQVIAIDLIPPFLQQVEERAADAGLSDRITTRQHSMNELDYPEQSIDLIWSESAIYNIGFDAGLTAWRRFIKPGGCIAVTEPSWLVEDPPSAVREFWDEHYPAMRSREENEAAVADCGYQLLDSFVLSDSEWWDDYYRPIEERIAAMRLEREDEHWQAALDAAQLESDIVREGLHAFGYVFYVMKKID